MAGTLEITQIEKDYYLNQTSMALGFHGVALDSLNIKSERLREKRRGPKLYTLNHLYVHSTDTNIQKKMSKHHHFVSTPFSFQKKHFMYGCFQK